MLFDWINIMKWNNLANFWLWHNNFIKHLILWKAKYSSVNAMLLKCIKNVLKLPFSGMTKISQVPTYLLLRNIVVYKCLHTRSYNIDMYMYKIYTKKCGIAIYIQLGRDVSVKAFCVHMWTLITKLCYWRYIPDMNYYRVETFI